MNDKYSSDIEKVFEYFNSNYEKYGYSAKSLGWLKGKQNIRFDALTKFLDMKKPFSILDIGCGFGDLNLFFKARGIEDYTYQGIDLIEGMIEKANEIYRGKENIKFYCGDFLHDMTCANRYDYVIASGIFNIQMNKYGNYEHVEMILKKALDVCKEDGAVSFDFQSDKVDYFSDNGISFYNSPEKILSIAYKFSRNVVLNNLYMPFEFSLTVFKDDSFERNIVFSKFIHENRKEFDEGIFYEESID